MSPAMPGRSPVLLWRIADAADLVGPLDALGLRLFPLPAGGRPGEAAWAFRLGGLSVVLAPAGAHRPDVRLWGTDAPAAFDPEDAILVRAARTGPTTAGPRSSGPQPNGPRTVADLLSIGWATVDLEDAAARLGMPVADAPRDVALGARAARVVGAAGPPLLLLEPDGEGLLAASLARFGPGPSVLYVGPAVAASAGARPQPVATPTDRPDADPSPLRPPARGPFGRQRLLGGRPPWGPHVIVVMGTEVGADDAEPERAEPERASDRVPSRR